MQPFWATLVGDVVDSRRHPDRAQLQSTLTALLDDVDARVGGTLAITVGDEFQGRYHTLGEAVEASLRIHLAAHGSVQVRIGLGWGEVVVEAPDRGLMGQDGPAWWRARDAIDTLAGPAGSGQTRVATGTSWDDLLNAYLILRDSVIGGWDDVDVSILRALLAGDTQRAVAGRLGLHESSVSRRVHRRGIGAVLAQASLVIPLAGELESVTGRAAE
ncbi:SatD family protein [soil metagenome]